MIDPFAPTKLGPIELRNRIIKAATFEGRTPKRLVTHELIDFHRRVAAGGVGMSTVAYCAVSPDGGTDGRQIVLTDEAVPGIRQTTSPALRTISSGRRRPPCPAASTPSSYTWGTTTC